MSSSAAGLRELMRLRLLPSALADVVAGTALAGGILEVEVVALLRTCACSAFLYTAGMVLNDVADAERDRRLAPRRPIPSGRVSRPVAGLFGALLLVVGLVVAPPALGWIPVGLAILILLYDFFASAWIALGGLVLGLCRATNLYMGFFLAPTPAESLGLYVAALGYLIYVAFTVWHGKLEEGRPSAELSRGVAMVPALCGPIAGLFLPYRLLAQVAALPTLFLVFRGRERHEDWVAKRTGVLLRGLTRYTCLLAVGMGAWVEAILIAIPAYVMPPLMGKVRWT